jgi:uncharacterized protein YecT (DUF1311 family)
MVGSSNAYLLVTGPAAALGVVLVATPAAALDCKSAATVQEKAICADPAAQAADAAMTKAFVALRSTIDVADRNALLADQRNWLKDRDGDCTTDRTGQAITGRALSACLAKESDERRLFLSGQPSDGPGAVRPILPFFLKGKGSDTVISGLRFANPQSTGEKLFNNVVNDQLKDVHVSDGSEGDSTDEFNMALDYAAPDFISAHITFSYEGRAHPMDYGYDINIDLRTGTELSFLDVFRHEALDQLVNECKPQLDDYIGEAAKADLFPEMMEAVLKDREKTVRAAIGDISRWAFGGSQTIVTIDDAAADIETACSFDSAHLKPLMQPHFTLLP